MSKYSGKCDVYDWLGDLTDEQISDCKIYLENECMPLRINTQRDLMPYYPRLVLMGWGSGGVRCARLTTESYVDIEEREHLGWKLDRVLRIYRGKKRKHEPFILEEILKEVVTCGGEDTWKEIVNRVAEFGGKATVDGLHTEIHEYLRNELYKDMVAAGYDARFARWWIWHDWKDYSEVKYAEAQVHDT